MSNVRKEPECGGDNSGQIQGHLTQEDLSYEQFQDQLTDLLFQPKNEETDIEAVGHLLDRLEELNPFPEKLDVEKSLERFHWQYAPIFDAVGAREETPPPPAEKKRPRLSFIKAIAIAAALLLLLCTTAQALDLDIFSAIARWTSEIFGFSSHSFSFATVKRNPLKEGETASFDSLEEAVAAFGIEAPIVPKEIPERFELVSVKANNLYSGIDIYADYICEDSYLHIEYMETIGQSYHTIEKENGDIESYYIGEIGHYLMSDHHCMKALWVNGDFECQLYGTVSEQELKGIIDSIYMKEK